MHDIRRGLNVCGIHLCAGGNVRVKFRVCQADLNIIFEVVVISLDLCRERTSFLLLVNLQLSHLRRVGSTVHSI